MSRRTDIVTAIATKLAELSSIGTIFETSDDYIHDLEDDGITMPIANVLITGAEMNDEESSLSDTQHYLEVSVITITKDDNAEALFESINNKIFEDSTVGGYADYIQAIVPKIDVRLDDDNHADSVMNTFRMSYQLPNGQV